MESTASVTPAPDAGAANPAFLDAALALRLGAWLLACFALSALLDALPVDALRWLLAPPVALVELAGLASFEWEPGFGYLSREELFVVTERCDGANFLVVTFALFAWRFGRGATAGRGPVLVRAASVALLTTAVTNAVRIGGAILLHRQDWSGTGWTFEAVHELESILVYALALYGAAHQLPRRRTNEYRGNSEPRSPAANTERAPTPPRAEDCSGTE